MGTEGFGIGLGAAIIAIIALSRQLLTDTTFRREWRAEKQEWKDDILGMEKRFAILDAKYDEERKLKHKYQNDLIAHQTMLSVIVKLSEECTCGALKVIDDFMKQFKEEMGVYTKDVEI